MKPSTNRNLAIGIACASSLVSSISVDALRYCRAAKRDESRGFPFTAGMEWRRAAEIAGPVPLLQEYCWREWERIMQLPRRLAQPIGATPVIQACEQPNSKLADMFRDDMFRALSLAPLTA